MSEQALLELKIAFFDHSQDPYCFFNDRLEFVHVNNAYEKVLKLNRDEIIGKPMAEIFPSAKETGRDKQYLEVLRTGVPLTIDAFTNHPNSGSIYTRVVAFKVDEFLAVSLSTITDLKNLIETLDNFVYRATHDMKTPVNSILGLLSLAQKSSKAEDKVDYLKIINKEVLRLNGLLGKLIETARVKHAVVQSQHLDVRKIVREVIESLSYIPEFSFVHISVDIANDLDFHSDEMLFLSIVQNLIDNGLKYRHEEKDHQEVRVQIRKTENGILLRVEDNGIGIPTSMHQNVFSLFFRINNHIPGTGLGLYSVKDNIHKLGGSIEFTSEENEGTCFLVTLPSKPVSSVAGNGIKN